MTAQFNKASAVVVTLLEAGAEATHRCNARIIDLNSTAERKLVNDNPYYAFATIPKGTYKTIDSNVITFGVMVSFVTSTDVSKEVV